MKRAAVLACTALLHACSPGGPAYDAERATQARAFFSAEELASVLRASPLPELPPDPTNAVAADPRAARLGQAIFYDERFSGSGKHSCASCHDPALQWTDGKPTAEGIAAFETHTPSLWNVAYNRWFFWNGRADTLWAQALQPLEHPDEQGGDRLLFAHLIHDDATLRFAYEELFGPLPGLGDAARFPPRGRPVPDDPEQPLQIAWSSMSVEDRVAVDRVFANVGKLLAAFERRIVTGDTPFDLYVRGLRTGDPELLGALSADARAGAKLFFGEARCHLCHHGPLFSDREFHDVRLPGPRSPADGRGRWDGILLVLNDPFNGVGAFSDDPEHARVQLAYLDRSPHTIGEHKTPSLRNVATTAPYMHRGQIGSLREVLEHYSKLADAAPRTHEDPAEVLVPVNLDGRETDQLVAFLESLTSGPVDPALAGPPEL